jgi:hypothetical protein
MTVIEQIVEQAIGNLEERGSGIYVKHLRNRSIYTCKCPTCGTLHGGYPSFEEAAMNQKCRRCNRNAVEKLKKEVAKVDEPEKPQKDIFQNPLKKPQVIESDDDEDVKSILSGLPLDTSGSYDVTKEVCLAAHCGQNFYSRTDMMADGSPLRVRVSGKCKTWVTRPNEYRIPVKFGLYQSFYITHADADQWSTVPLGSDGEPLQ